jgi:phosphoketolase
MVMLNDLDRFHLVMDVIDRVPGLGSKAAAIRQEMADQRLRCRAWTPRSRSRARRGDRYRPRHRGRPTTQ